MTDKIINPTEIVNTTKHRAPTEVKAWESAQCGTCKHLGPLNIERVYAVCPRKVGTMKQLRKATSEACELWGRK